MVVLGVKVEAEGQLPPYMCHICVVSGVGCNVKVEAERQLPPYMCHICVVLGVGCEVGGGS